MTTYQFDQSILDSLPPLTSGSHKDTDDAVCAMEAAARACGLGTTDHPECTCRVLAAFVRSLNDRLDDNASRDRIIRPLIPLMVGTADDGHAEERMWICADRAVRIFAGNALESAGLISEAKVLREMAPIRDVESAYSAYSAAWAAKSAAWAAKSAAWAAESAAWAAWAAASAAWAAESAAKSAAWAAKSAAWAAKNEEAIISTLRELCMVGKSEKP